MVWFVVGSALRLGFDGAINLRWPDPCVALVIVTLAIPLLMRLPAVQAPWSLLLALLLTSAGWFSTALNEWGLERLEFGAANWTATAIEIWFQRHIPADLHGWFLGLFLGHRAGIPADTLKGFKIAGLYHLLVVSGMHVGLIAISLNVFVGLSLRLLSICRLLPATTTADLNSMSRHLVASLVWLFAWVAGMSAAAQRAALIFAVVYWTTRGDHKLVRRIFWCLGLQMILFPQSWASAGSLMSWSVYLLIVGRPRNPLRAYAVIQLGATLIAGYLFKDLAFWGLVTNGLIAPGFSAIYGLALLGMGFVFFGGDAVWFCDWLFGIQRKFVAMLTWFQSLEGSVWSLRLVGQSAPDMIFLGAGLVGYAVLLNSCRELSIRSIQPDA